jgi:hypothetical protein
MAKRNLIGLKTGVLVACSAVCGSPLAWGGSVSYTGGNCPTGTSCTGTAFGALTLPVNITFTDNLGTNSTGSSVQTTDNWTFSVPAASASATVTGDQIDLQNFSFTGTVDSFTLYAVNGNTLTTVASGTPTNPFSSVILDASVSAGNYELQVVSTLAAGSTGSYTGVLVAAAPVPLPGAAWLLMSAVAGLGSLKRRRDTETSAG